MEINTRSKVVWSVVIILIFIVVVLFGLRIFRASRTTHLTVCPLATCQSGYIGDDGKIPGNIGVSNEPGVTHQTFTNTIPTGFPKDMPVDPKPIKVMASFVDTYAADTAAQEPAHTQVTYSYSSLQGVQATVDNFTKYLKSVGYNATLTKQNSTKLSYSILGQMKSTGLNQYVSVTIKAEDSQVEVVSISFITSEVTVK